MSDQNERRHVVARLKGVQIRVNGRSILGPIDFDLGRSEHWAVLGPNGAGKTTLLSVLGAERHPSVGFVEILGEQMGKADVRELRRHIGVVGHRVSDRVPLQSSATEIVLTGRDGILAPWWGNFSEGDVLYARELLQRVGCHHVLDQAFGRCSQGERQRILLARSFFGEHELLLLDEPTVGVDFPGREALISALDELSGNANAPSTVHVVHTLEELPGSTSHALLMREGRVVEKGLIEHVLTSEALEKCFAMALTVESRDGRYSARATRTY